MTINLLTHITPVSPIDVIIVTPAHRVLQKKKLPYGTLEIHSFLLIVLFNVNLFLAFAFDQNNHQMTK